MKSYSRLPLVLLCIANSAIVHGINYKFTVTPGTVNETFSSTIVIDDDVDVSFSGTNPSRVPPVANNPLAKGDKVTVDFVYANAYLVNSGDDADVDFLRFSGIQGGGAVVADMTVQLTDPAGNLIGNKATFTGVNFALGVAIGEGNDLLGNLQGLTVCDFHAELTLTAATVGTLTLTDFSFGWEANDITSTPKKKVPDGGSTLLLSGLSFALLACARGFLCQAGRG